MDKPWEINCESALIIGDIHQRISWAQAILEREAGNFDKVIFLGDFFDTHFEGPETATIKETAAFYKFVINNYNVCMGNHEGGYRESWAANQKYSHKHHLAHA